MNTSHRILRLAGLAAGLVLAGASLARADYLETFAYSGSGSNNQSASVAGWSAYMGATATDITSTTGGTQYVAVTNLAGNPGPALGFLAIVNSGTPTPAATNYATFETGFSVANAGTITWNMNGNGTASPVRVLVQVGGSWYASNTTILPTHFSSGAAFTDAASVDVAKSFTFTTDKSAWRAFTFTSGSTMSVAGSTISSDLTSSTITGIGFYAEMASGSILRIDQLAITASSIPEPGAYSLILGGAFLFCAMVRRRKV